MMPAWAVVVALGVIAVVGSAKVIVVSPTGAIRSLDDVRNATGGDVIELRGGTYAAKQTVWGRFNGTEGAPIIIRPAAGETVVFDGTACDFSTGNSALLTFGIVHDVVLQGPIEVRNAKNGVVFLNCERITV
jgi:hypothetical protein